VLYWTIEVISSGSSSESHLFFRRVKEALVNQIGSKSCCYAAQLVSVSHAVE